MAEKDYIKTVYVDLSEPDIDAEHMNNIEDGIDGLYHPEFDDSGTVEGITSFPTFLSTVVKRMNPIAFYKNFKAGMKYVLHTGSLINNGLCTETGKYAADATQLNPNIENTLAWQVAKVNSDLGEKANSSELSKYFPKNRMCPVYLDTAANNGYINVNFPWPLSHDGYSIISNISDIEVSNKTVNGCTFHKTSWGNNTPWALILIITNW